MNRLRGALAISLIMTVLALVYIYPLILVILNSLKTFAQIMENVIALPSHLEWENFAMHSASCDTRTCSSTRSS